MNAALLAARLVLALVFLVAGLGKLADLPGSRKAVRDFGLPASLAGPIGVVLPLVELAIAVALIPTASAWAAAIAALALLALFILTISVNLARGRKPDCHCFGQVASGPIGWWTLVRNGVLAAIAIFIVAEGSKNAGTSAVEWTTKLNNPEKVGLVLAILAFALILAQWGFLLELLRQNGRLLERLESLERAVSAVGTQGSQAAPEPQPAAPPEPVFGRPVGSPAPGFVLSGLYGETMTLDALRAQGRPVLLVFTDPGCGPCGELLPEIGRWQQEYENRMVIAVISRGTPEANRAKMAEHGIRNVLLQQDDEVARSFQYPGTPSAVMVQAEGVIGTPVSAGPGGIRTLVASLMGAPSEAPAAPAPIPSPASPPLPLLDEMPTPAPAPNGGNGSAPSPAPVAARVGDPAPALALKDLDNHTVDLSQLRGEPTALIFWNLGCGFCQRMLPDLKEWEKNKPAEAPRVMVISSGSVEDNRAMGLRSTVLLDNNFQAGQSFGAQGTPMAVLIDADGRIASEVAAGAPGVFPLLGGAPAGAQSAAPPPPPQGVKVGDPAPALRFPDLNGKTVNLSDFRGSDTLVLFWSNQCGFCQQMLPDLKTWEANRPKGAPKLLVVSRGTAEENRAMGLRSTVVLDDNFQAGSAFGAGGTPMGVVVDANGHVASEVAAGADAVFGLVGGRPSGAQPVGG